MEDGAIIFCVFPRALLVHKCYESVIRPIEASQCGLARNRPLCPLYPLRTKLNHANRELMVACNGVHSDGSGY